MLNWELGSITKRNLDFIFILLICSSSISYPVSTANPLTRYCYCYCCCSDYMHITWTYAYIYWHLIVISFCFLNQQQGLGQVFRSHSHTIPCTSNIVYNALFKLLYAFIASYLNIRISWHDGRSIWEKIFSRIWR